MNTKQKGLISETAITLALIKKGAFVLKPINENQRYDLVVDDGKKFFRVQCKTAKFHNGSLICNTGRVGRLNYTNADCKAVKIKYSASDIDAVGIYSPDLDKCYLIPVQELCDSQNKVKSSITLRVMPLKSPQGKNIKWASKYEI